ncbi:MAG: GGDEF domain-containing protein [Pseudomonadota bacterium]
MTNSDLMAQKAQRLRIQRFSLAAASYIVGGGLLLAVSMLGSDQIPITSTVASVFMALVIAANLGFYLLFRSGLNQRFGDPSLTIPQMATGILLITYLIYFAGAYRGLLSIFYLAVMTFGLFHLNTRQLLGMSAFTLVSFAFMAVLLEFNHPDAASFMDLFAQLAVIGGLLPWFAVLGGHISTLRRRLVEGNRRLEQALAQIREIAIRDDLTGAFNRRHLMDLIMHQKAVADRGSYRFSLCILDLDHFKRINDEYGHLIGDRALQAVAEILGQQVRVGDIVGRFGGEEFVILLSETPLQAAAETAERLRQQIEEHAATAMPEGVTVTASIGVTEYLAGEPIEAALARADRALYRAKAAGRNCVRIEMPPDRDPTRRAIGAA